MASLHRISFLLLILFGPSLYADDIPHRGMKAWVSPIELKYKEKNPELFEKYVQAKSLLDDTIPQNNSKQEAAILLQEILSQDPQHVPAIMQFARLVKSVGYLSGSDYLPGNLTNADAITKYALTLEPEYEDAYVFLAHLYIHQRNLHAAKEALDKAKELGSRSIWYYFNRSDLYYNQGKLNEAYNILRSIPQHRHLGTDYRKAAINSLERMANLMAASENPENTFKIYEELLEFDGEDAWNWGNLARYQLTISVDYEAAIISSDKALSLMNYGHARATKAASLYTKWAVLSEQAGQEENARKAFQEAQEIVPDIPVVLRALKCSQKLNFVKEKLVEYANSLQPEEPLNVEGYMSC